MSKRWNYTLREVSAEVFVDKDSDFDPDVADSLPNSREQVCKTNQQDNVEMTVFRVFSAENTVVTPQIFLSSSFTNCWKIVSEWYLLKIEHSTACSCLIMCAKFGGAALCRSGVNEL